MKKILPFLLLLTACGKEKVFVFTKGDITVSGTNISVAEGNNFSEKEIDLSGSKNTLSVKASSGNFSVYLPGAGLYILNVRKDTVVGSFQKIGKDLNAPEMSIEDLGLKIDSLQKLIANGNVSPANKNFFIRSNELKKITDNLDAIIVPPFELIPNSFATNNGIPEIYKFYTSAEMHDMIEKLQKVGK